MERNIIQLSNKTYQRLLEESARLQTTPDELIEQLLGENVADLPPTVWPEDEEDPDDPWPPRETTVEEALAAVERLTTLFADIQIDPDRLEELINDPMNQMINANLPELP